MKKLAILLCVFALSVSLLACGPKDKEVIYSTYDPLASSHTDTGSKEDKTKTESETKKDEPKKTTGSTSATVSVDSKGGEIAIKDNSIPSASKETNTSTVDTSSEEKTSGNNSSSTSSTDEKGRKLDDSKYDMPGVPLP